jgi:hypothetical protein
MSQANRHCEVPKATRQSGSYYSRTIFGLPLCARNGAKDGPTAPNPLCLPTSSASVREIETSSDGTEPA